MSSFSNVSVIKQANIYFDGAVTSRTIEFENGETKTLGIIQPGEYIFNTTKKEIIEVLAGEVDVVLTGESERSHYKAGDSFEIPANSSFDIRAITLTDYCCSYVD